MNPEKPAAKGKAKAKVPATRKKKAAPPSESSEEEPLASGVVVKEKKKRATRAAAKKDKPVPLTVEQLNLEFEKMMLEPENYIKVLRYEVCVSIFTHDTSVDLGPSAILFRRIGRDGY